MYNVNRPSEKELPTTKELVRSTIVAFVSACVILVTIILPAEYGVDPTGAGRLLGLKKMGEIKTSLKADAIKDANEAGQKSVIAKAQSEKAVQVSVVEQNHEKIIVLKPGEGTEVKLIMSKGAKVDYHWNVTGGVVNYDTHGDPADAPAGFYHGYGKGKQASGKVGEIIAAFDGKHGWFWRNRSEKPVTIVLKTKGQYSSFFN